MAKPAVTNWELCSAATVKFTPENVSNVSGTLRKGFAGSRDRNRRRSRRRARRREEGVETEDPPGKAVTEEGVKAVLWSPRQSAGGKIHGPSESV